MFFCWRSQSSSIAVEKSWPFGSTYEADAETASALHFFLGSRCSKCLFSAQTVCRRFGAWVGQGLWLRPVAFGLGPGCWIRGPKVWPCLAPTFAITGWAFWILCCGGPRFLARRQLAPRKVQRIAQHLCLRLSAPRYSRGHFLHQDLCISFMENLYILWTDQSLSCNRNSGWKKMQRISCTRLRYLSIRLSPWIFWSSKFPETQQGPSFFGDVEPVLDDESIYIYTRVMCARASMPWTTFLLCPRGLTVFIFSCASAGASFSALFLFFFCECYCLKK